MKIISPGTIASPSGPTLLNVVISYGAFTDFAGYTTLFAKSQSVTRPFVRRTGLKSRTRLPSLSYS